MRSELVIALVLLATFISPPFGIPDTPMPSMIVETRPEGPPYSGIMFTVESDSVAVSDCDRKGAPYSGVTVYER